jgi:hypothetical protein
MFEAAAAAAGELLPEEALRGATDMEAARRHISELCLTWCSCQFPF